MAVTIVEIKRRAEQGVTRPFLCRGDDNLWYWVKGNSAGKAALCREWLAGRIAQDFGLPIPRFEQVVVPSNLIEFSAVSDANDLGAGLAFGSEHVAGASELTLSCLNLIPAELRHRILVFDWWIQNQDRTLGDEGGNVNLLWTPDDSKLWIIDHNVAFDSSFDGASFRSDHVFRAEFSAGSTGTALDLKSRMQDIASRFDRYWVEMPEEWVEVALLGSDFSRELCERMISRYGLMDDTFRDATP